MYNFVFIASLLKTPYKFHIIQPYGRYCANSQHNILIKLYALLTTFFCLTLRHHGKLFFASIISVYAGSCVLYIYDYSLFILYILSNLYHRQKKQTFRFCLFAQLEQSRVMETSY